MKKILSYGLIAALIGAGVYCTFFRSSDGSEEKRERTLVSKKKIASAPSSRGNRRPVSLSPKKKQSGSPLPSAPAVLRRPPEMLGVGLLEEKELTDLAKSVLRELQRAIDAKDLKALRALVARMYGDPEAVLGMADIPPAFRRKLVQAFAWFGGEGALDLMQFLADDDPTVVEMTRDAYVMEAMDFTVSDRERAEYILAALQTLTDERTVSMLMPAVQSLRHSVGVETLKQVMATGTDVAQAKVANSVHAFTQDPDVQTAADLDDWLAKHPDGPMDEQFYGGWEAMSKGLRSRIQEK